MTIGPLNSQIRKILTGMIRSLIPSLTLKTYRSMYCITKLMYTCMLLIELVLARVTNK